jgi:hypothetical protein
LGTADLGADTVVEAALGADMREVAVLAAADTAAAAGTVERPRKNNFQ